MNTKQLMIGLGFSMMVAASVPAVAVDGKTLPGAACQPISNTQVFTRDNTGVLFNTSSAAQTVICPVVRDTIALDPINGIITASVVVIDNNNAAGDPKVTCALESRNINGASVETFVDNSVPGASPVPQILNDYANLTSSEAGYYYFRCSIPGVHETRRSGIVMYRVYEDD